MMETHGTAATETASEVEFPEGCEDATVIPGYDRETDPPLQMYGFTDLANGQRFSWRYAGKFAYTKATGWLVYDRGRWLLDKTHRAEQAMRSTLNLIVQEGDLVDSGDMTDKEADDMRKAFHSWATSCQNLSLFNNAMKTAQTMVEFTRDYAIFDQQPDLFLCGNGTLNLSTGEFGPFDPKHLLTKGSNVVYDPTAICPKWEKFLSDVQQGKEHMIRYLARAVGYTLTTDTGGQCLFVPYGTGGTGKSQFLNVLRGVLGEYSFDADAEMFMSKHGDSGQPFENAGMEGKRGLFAVETEAGKELACVKVKRMTGQDPIRASYKGRDHYTIIPFFKVWLATNDRPKMNATDDAMWDRPKLIPFDVKFRDQPSEIKNIAAMLLAEEASGILNWMLAGHAEWKAKGLDHPQEVKYAVAEWREDEDYLGRWLCEVTVKTDVQNDFVPKKDLHERYSASGKEADGISQRDFNEAMKRKGFLSDQKWVKGRNQKVWLNLKYTGTMGNYGDTASQMPDMGNL
jgi:putative DNA primase/helicase